MNIFKRWRPSQSLDWPARLQALAANCKEPRLRAFYEAAAPAADTPLEQVPLLALDVETTGLDPSRDAIVSLGLIPFSLQRIRCAEGRYWVVKPDTDLAAESVTFHHITHSDIHRAPPLAAILDELLSHMAGRVMVVHYRHIERQFLDQAARLHLGESWQFPLIDTMQLEALLYPRRQPNQLQRLLGRKPVSIRLDDSRRRYHLPPYMAHHALTDALATAELLQAQVATHYTAQTPVGSLWS